MGIDQRLEQLGVRLPQVTLPAANYANAVRAGDLLFLAGKAPAKVNGRLPRGRLGKELSVKEGQAHARSAAIELMAVLRAELGSLERVVRIVEVQGFVNADASFEEHAAVLDGASDLLVEVFREKGIHARSVLGASSLRGGVPVILRAVAQVRD